MECPRCGNQNKPDAKYCQDCGLALKTANKSDLAETLAQFGENLNKLGTAWMSLIFWLFILALIGFCAYSILIQ